MDDRARKFNQLARCYHDRKIIRRIVDRCRQPIEHLLSQPLRQFQIRIELGPGVQEVIALPNVQREVVEGVLSFFIIIKELVGRAVRLFGDHYRGRTGPVVQVAWEMVENRTSEPVRVERILQHQTE